MNEQTTFDAFDAPTPEEPEIATDGGQEIDDDLDADTLEAVDRGSIAEVVDENGDDPDDEFPVDPDEIRPGDLVVTMNGEERRVVDWPVIPDDDLPYVRAAKRPFTGTPARMFVADLVERRDRQADREFDEEPAAPDDLPEYVVDAISRQSPRRLDAIAEYAERLAAYQRQEGDDDEPEVEYQGGADGLDEIDAEIVDAGQEFASIDGLARALPAGVSTHIKMIPSGDSKRAYVYANWRKNGEHKTKYLGPASKYGIER